MKLFQFLIPILITGIFYSCNEKEKIEYYANGNKRIEAKIDNRGVLNGSFRSYYENGQLAYKGEYKDGLKIGKHLQYYEDGKLKDEFLYEIRKDNEHLVDKKKYAPDGLIYLDAKNVEGNFNINVLNKEVLLGDTIKVIIELLDPKYENSLAIIAAFDKNLNLTDSADIIGNFIGNNHHQVILKVLPKEVGRNRFTGLFRDFTIDLIPNNDSLGYRIAEDSFFEFSVTVNARKSI